MNSTQTNSPGNSTDGMIFSTPSRNTLPSDTRTLPRLPISISSEDFPLSYENISDIHSLSVFPLFSKEGRRVIQNCTGENVDFDSYVLSWPPWRRRKMLDLEATRQHFAQNGHINLPDKQIVLQHVQAFCRSSLSRWLPVIDEELFLYTIQAAYDGDLTWYSPQRAGAKACIFAVMTFISSFLDHIKLSSSSDVSRYAYEAQSLLFDVLQGPPTLDSVQTRLILVGTARFCICFPRLCRAGLSLSKKYFTLMNSL